MNPHILRLILFNSLVLAVVPPAAARILPVSVQVQQWIQACEKGYAEGQYAKVLPACQRAVDALEPLLPETPTFATALHDLAMVAMAQGNYIQAEPLFLRSLRLREKTLGPEHPMVAQSLNNLALLYGAQGKYVQAEPLLLRSLRIREKLGPEHLDVADSLMDLAALYESQGNYASSEPLKLRSLRICEKKLDPNHPTLAIALNNVGMLYKAQGKYVQAEPYCLRSVKIFEKTLDPDHPTLTTALSNLATIYHDQGNYSQAEPLYTRSLRSAEKLGPEHPLVALRLNNLALLYKDQKKSAQAELLYRRSLAIWEKLHGPEHPDVATVFNNLAGLYQDQGNYAQAELFYLRSLKIREKILGPEHPLVATTLNNLAGLYQETGDLAQSELHYTRSLQIREKVLGLDHPFVAGSLNNLAALRMAQSRTEQALTLFERALGIRESELRTVATEARISTLLDTMRIDEDRAYSLLLLKNPSGEAQTLALRTSLLRKGRSAEAGLMTGWSIQTSLTSDDQRERFGRWQGLRNQYESLFLRGPAKLGDSFRGAHTARLAELKNQIENQEDGLAHSAPQLQQRKLPEPQAITQQVAARLPMGSAFVDVLWFRPVLFQATGPAMNRQGPPRYIALILFPDERSNFVDLGDAEQIDRMAMELMAAMRDLRQEPLPQAQALYQIVMAPLLAKLGSVQRIYLSLDGSLNLVPFTALHDGKQYLLDAPYQIQHLSSGRDLLRGALGQPQQPAVVMADPDFGGSAKGTTPTALRTVDVNTRSLYAGLASLPQLKGARAEGAFVGDVLHVPPLLGMQATEARLRLVRSPWVLHIATHGLFLNSASPGNREGAAKTGTVSPSDPAKPGTDSTDNHSSSRSALLLASSASAASSSAAPQASALTAEEAHSQSQSALVLAGAAHAAAAPDAANDGLLTAEEARTLSLFGTQLVVLSACDTGRGMVRAGQGVYGLRRAFLAAGAQTVVMSLWPVSDSTTQGLMQRYYLLLLDDKKPRGRISGLLEAMKAVKAERPHPYYWAPFIANGLDAPLQSPPARSVPLPKGS